VKSITHSLSVSDSWWPCIQFHIYMKLWVQGQSQVKKSHILTFSIWLFKSHVSAVARALFNLNPHCGTAFSLLDEKDIHSMGQHCPVHLLKVN
jgi:hypothetical protein